LTIFSFEQLIDSQF